MMMMMMMMTTMMTMMIEDKREFRVVWAMELHSALRHCSTDWRIDPQL
jgi:hypothetical protein